MVTRNVDYRDGDTALRGVLVYDDASAAKRPALLMVPNWYGVNAAAIEKAKGIAGSDYVIFLADMYGTAIRPKNNDQAMAAVKPLYGARPVMRKRVAAGLAELRRLIATAPIDPARIAAIGFCFGGSSVLDLARSGADIKAVVSFHGGLDTDDPTLAKHIKAAVLAMNGADDKGTMPDAPAFRAEMQQSPADWEFMVFGHAVHCFTEVGENSPGCRYDAKVSARAYRLMHDWLREAFAGGAPR
ncbi:MAG TPA: dienelactone hydrolase family protein [Rhodanobacteraceae bacterium]|nr:dienelactone hydrolase family protein [Rhodanobacteraceae bacterium]